MKSKLQESILHSVPQGHVVPSKASNFAIIKAKHFCPMELFLKIGHEGSNVLTFLKVFILTLLTMNFCNILHYLRVLSYQATELFFGLKDFISNYN